MAIKVDKSKMVRNLARNTKLVQHLDKAIGKGDFIWQYEYEPKKADDAWHPSGHCTPSVYELYHDAKGSVWMNPGVPTVPVAPHPASLLKTFQVGHFWHAYLQWIVEKQLGFCEAKHIERRGKRVWQQSIGRADAPTAFHWVTGSADIAPCSIPGHDDYLVDFKTMGAHDFKPMAAPKWAVGKWECQLNIYMDFFDIEKALIVGILKDSPHEFKEFEFHRNQELVDALYSKWKLVSACLDEGVEPPEDEEIELPLRGPIDT